MSEQKLYIKKYDEEEVVLEESDLNNHVLLKFDNLGDREVILVAIRTCGLEKYTVEPW